MALAAFSLSLGGLGSCGWMVCAADLLFDLQRVLNCITLGGNSAVHDSTANAISSGVQDDNTFDQFFIVS